jgi:hypothetical protein
MSSTHTLVNQVQKIAATTVRISRQICHFSSISLSEQPKQLDLTKRRRDDGLVGMLNG